MREKNFQNTVVFSGLKIKNADLTEKGEFDFIIISLPLKSIVQVEAKRGNNQKNRDHAKAQLDRGQAFFEENLPFPSSENWNYVKMMCFGESVDYDICENCKPFVLGSNFLMENTIQSVSEDIAHQFLNFLNTFFKDYDTGMIN